MLVVDDDEPVLLMTKLVVEHGGYTVLTASDGQEAIEKFRQNSDSIRVVVVDMVMPTMKGDEVVRNIREIRSDANILLASGYHDINLDDIHAGEGRTAIIHKPYRMANLLEKLKQFE